MQQLIVQLPRIVDLMWFAIEEWFYLKRIHELTKYKFVGGGKFMSSLRGAIALYKNWHVVCCFLYPNYCSHILSLHHAHKDVPCSVQCICQSVNKD